jgi:hypothetical protein
MNCVSFGRAAVVAWATVLAAASAPGAPLSADQAGWVAQGRRHAQAGWIRLHLEGEARPRGFQHGYLLAPEIAECLRVTRAQWSHDTAMSWEWLVQNTRGFVLAGLDAENREEIAGIAAGMTAAGRPASFDDIMTYNAWIELSSYWWPLAQRKLDGGDHVQKPQESCSAFIATGRMTRDGRIVLGHNTMFDYTQALANVVVDLKPAKGHRILMQTQPGWIHSGTDFFITDAGLVGAETTIGSFTHFTEKGRPEFARMRRATQDSDSIDAWCGAMKDGNNGGYANAWLLGDIKTGEIARLELGLKYIGFERTKDGYFTGSNIAENPQILRMETTVRDTDLRISSVARRVRWQQLMKANAGKIDLVVAKAMESDVYDPLLHRNAPGVRSLNGRCDLDPAGNAVRSPFEPFGTFDAKVVDAAMAERMSFAARWGSADGSGFDAAAFLAAQPQYEWMEGILKSRPKEPWTILSADKPTAAH